MAFTKTLQQFSDRVQFLADIRGQVGTDATVDRHPQADVFELASDDYRLLRTDLTRLGYSEFLVATSPAALSTTAQATGETFAVQTSPAGAISIRGVDILVRGEWRSLNHITWEQRRSTPVRADLGGFPGYWSEISMGSVATTVLTAGTIGIFPRPTTTIQHRIWYLPEFTAITDATHLFLYGDASWWDWHTAKTAWTIAAIRDNDAKKRADNLEKMRAAAFSTMESMAPKRQVDGTRTQFRNDCYNS